MVGVRVMGIDPGLVATGYGCLQAGTDRASVSVVGLGVISTASDGPLEQRLQVLYEHLTDVLATHAPDVIAVEDLYAEYRFPRTAILMGHARGVIYLAAAQRRVTVLPLAPAEVKRMFTANGAASKTQVQRGVQAMLKLPDVPRPSHVADALGLAYMGLSRMADRR